MTEFFAACSRDLEYLLVDELTALGAQEVREARAGVRFSGDLETAYRAILWSRLASRVSQPLVRGGVEDDEQLYQLALTVPWQDHLPENGSLIIDAHTRHRGIKDNRYAALRVRDAINDRMREAGRGRPVVDRKQPDVRIRVLVAHKESVISVDLVGRSLPQRGYRQESGDAPLREDLAAGLLLRAGWPAMAESGGGLIDPLCGSGTLLIEGALMAADVAPGLAGPYAPRLETRWTGHDLDLWKSLVDDARERKLAGLARLGQRFVGFDRDRVLAMARRNAERAGLAEFLRFESKELRELERPKSLPSQGLLITNPPYGERLGDPGELFDLYRLLGARLQERFCGWNASVFTAEVELAHAIPFKPASRYKLRNGPLHCVLVNFGEIQQGDGDSGQAGTERPLGPGAEMLANRLKKNRKKLGKYLKKNEISCYRLYDADLPEYSAAVDVYGEQIHVQEYQAPAEIPVATARRRLSELVRVIGEEMQRPADAIVVKTRQRQRGRQQYERRENRGHFIEVEESGLRFRINLHDYLDTGLFLDHRETRQRIRDAAAGKRVLNLFCYTGSVTVYAAAGGAVETVSVDLSKTYLDWARENLRLNGFGGSEHRLVQADCLEWIQQDAASYDLIFVDPPTFSNSKRMKQDFDVQTHHVSLLRHCLDRLAPGGVVVFSNNFKKFHLDPEAFDDCEVKEVTHQTVPLDFQRSKPHRCWEIRRKRPA